jgi:hypothetical protein
MEDVDEVMRKLRGKPGEPVPVVDFADMRAVWAFVQDVQKRHPEGIAIGMGAYKSVCSPGADIRAVGYRLSMLGLLEHFLQPAYTGGQWSEAALKAAAKMELTWLPVGVPQKGLPFDVMQFLAQAQAEAV